MIRVENLSSFLLLNSAKNDPVAHGLVNYLKYFAKMDDELSAEHLQNFFRHMLSFTYWVQNKQLLHSQSRSLWDTFQKSFPAVFEQEIYWPEQMQLIAISQPSEFLKVLERYLGSKVSTGEQFRIIQTEKNQALAIIKSPNSGIMVRQLFNRFLLKDGILAPLREDFHLAYDDQLRLSPQKSHRYSCGPNLIAQIEGHQQGMMLRGFNLNCHIHFNDRDISDEKEFYYPLKKIESYFINKESDQFYTDLLTEIERVHRLIRFGEKNAVKRAQLLVVRAETIFKFVYPHDRILKLMLYKLQHQIEDLGGYREIEKQC